MKVRPAIANTLGRELVGGQQLVQVTGKEQWLDSLTVGQILKGRILRHYGESRYGVSFSGQERVVDSAVPLSVGDVLSGKVLGVSDHAVSLQLVQTTKASATDIPDQLQKQKSGEKFAQSTIAALIEQTRVQIDQSGIDAISKAAKEFAEPEMAIKIGLYLAKLGLPISRELVMAIGQRILEPQASGSLKLDSSTPKLASEWGAQADDVSAQRQALAISVLTQFFSKRQSQTMPDDDAIEVKLVLPKLPSNELERSEHTQKQKDFPDDGEQSAEKISTAQCFSRLLNIKLALHTIIDLKHYQ